MIFVSFKLDFILFLISAKKIQVETSKNVIKH